MALFQRQPAFCSNCGKKITVVVEYGVWVTCSDDCHRELNWKNTLSVMGKEYYPRKSELEDSDPG